MNIGVIVQARMGSTRLPGKTLKILIDKPVLFHVIERVKKSKYCKEIIVATTTNPEDDQIEAALKKISVACFRGDEANVLKRFYDCAKLYKLDLIVRITADDPFKDPLIIDQAIEIMLDNSELDYCSNTLHPTFPEGIDIEVFTMETLERAYRQAKLISEKEHVTPYVWKNPEKFKLHNFIYKNDLSHWRWTLDNEKDWLFVKTIYEELYNPDGFFYMEDIIDFLNAHPEVIEINRKTKRNEGYLKSLTKDSMEEYSNG